MDLPSVQALDLIDGQFDWIDDIYLESLPEEETDLTDKTVCLITEWLNEPTGYANRTFKRWQIGVEVQIFYKKDSDTTTLDGEIALADRFKCDDWTVDQSKTHIKDPDTGQVTKVFYFSKDLTIERN
jgi:hypothetical protein